MKMSYLTVFVALIFGALPARAGTLTDLHAAPSTTAMPAGSFVVAQSGPRYFVILGSFKSRAQAERRRSIFGDAYVVNTNDYPNFRNGYWSVVMGPFSKAVANQHRLANLEAVRDAYVKAGW